MSQEWNIKPRSASCQRCQTHFGDGQPYYTRLTFTEEGYVRTDCCETCWAQVADAPAVSSWKGVFRVPPPEPDRSLRKETAETLLRRLLAGPAQPHRNALYILAVMLERQRILTEREVRTAEDGTRTLVYEHRKTGEVILIRDPQLQLGGLERVQDEVSAMLAAPVEEEDDGTATAGGDDA